MIVPKIGYIRKTVPLLCFVLMTVWLIWWTGQNPLPDGYQNEFLHVGNTFDLYESLVQLDWWHVRWYAYTSYWPWGFYAVPMVLLLPFGKSIQLLILSNVLYLALLMWSMIRLGKRCNSPLAVYLLLLTPAVFGGATRFEPNFANVAMTSMGLLCLVESNCFQHRNWSLAWGLVFGSALMLDRLTVLFYLGPACLYVFTKVKWTDRRVRRSILYSMLLFLGCTLAYYREFFIRHSSELLSQAPVGEIDSAGTLLASTNPVPSMYYLFSLLDSQAGWAVGLLMLVGVFYAIKLRKEQDVLLLSATVPGVLFFTLVAKKQVYYTFPMLVPLALLAGRFHKLSWIGTGCGVLLWLQNGVGVIPESIPVQPTIPEKYVEPSYVLARPPSRQSYRVSDVLAQMVHQPQEVIVFSEDQGWYEGFVVLQLREQLDGHVRGVTADPVGIWEFSEQADYIVWVRSTSVQSDFPQSGSMTAELISDHYDVETLPAVPKRIAEMKPDFERIVDWNSDEDSIISLYKRTSIDPE